MKYLKDLSAAITIITFMIPLASRAEGSVSCVARLPPQYQGFEQNIGSGLRLIFRKTKYLLVYATNQRDECGAKKEMTVISTLEIPALSSDQWQGASFDCAAPSEAVTRGKPFIGVFDKADNSANTRALRGWTVDFAAKRFIPVGDAICYSFDK